ncbi:hypothetical protein OIU85_018779 [Salix viminalis]|uniref:Uncharacterized protein n=1 Tax=Salix viminalis TaxID=40686 RepID=A0A9Q0UV16_SALVM|nr:hypothetical protein OIU85_018779 [Salix viminalis]
MPRYEQFRRPHGGDDQMLHVLPPQFNPPSYQIQYPSSSNGGRTGGDISLSLTELHRRRQYQQWQAGPPQFANAAASSGFQLQIRTPQNWLQENGLDCLTRPS